MTELLVSSGGGYYSTNRISTHASAPHERGVNRHQGLALIWAVLAPFSALADQSALIFRFAGVVQ